MEDVDIHSLCSFLRHRAQDRHAAAIAGKTSHSSTGLPLAYTSTVKVNYAATELQADAGSASDRDDRAGSRASSGGSMSSDASQVDVSQALQVPRACVRTHRMSSTGGRRSTAKPPTSPILPKTTLGFVQRMDGAAAAVRQRKAGEARKAAEEAAAQRKAALAGAAEPSQFVARMDAYEDQRRAAAAAARDARYGTGRKADVVWEDVADDFFTRQEELETRIRNRA